MLISSGIPASPRSSRHFAQPSPLAAGHCFARSPRLVESLEIVSRVCCETSPASMRIRSAASLTSSAGRGSAHDSSCRSTAHFAGSKCQREVHAAQQRAGVDPRVRLSSIAGRRLALIERHPELLQLAASGSASCTSAPVARTALTTNSNGVFTLARYASGAKNSGDVRMVRSHFAHVAIGLEERRRRAVDQRRRRRVRRRSARASFGGDEVRRRGLRREDVEHLARRRLRRRPP